MERPEVLPVDAPQDIAVLAKDPSEDTVVWLGGEHDLSSAEELCGRSDVVIDLSRVEFMDSTTIDQILAARSRLGAQARRPASATRRPRGPVPAGDLRSVSPGRVLTSTGGRRERILSHLLDGASGEVTTRRLCATSAELTGMSGAGIMLMADDVAHGSLCSTDPRSTLIEQVQFTLGEGPCVDAHRQARTVSEPDLAGAGPTRWAAFAEPVVAAGVGAVFGFPLRVGAVRLGALNLYRDRPGDLTDDQHADALVLADVAAEVILLLPGPGTVRDAGGRAGPLRRPPPRRPPGGRHGRGPARDQRGRRPRAPPAPHAFAYDRPLREVADDVVARRLRFDTSDDQDE